PREQAMPWLDALDEALVVESRPNPDAIAGGHDVALIGSQRPQKPSDGAAILLAAIGFDDALQSMHAQHPARQTGDRVHGRHVRRFLPRPSRAGFFLNDCAPPRKLALGANALALRSGFFVEAVLVKAARPLPRARRLGAVLAHVHANFLLLRHALRPFLS